MRPGRIGRGAFIFWSDALVEYQKNARLLGAIRLT
jgi:hypothetical protein